MSTSYDNLLNIAMQTKKRERICNIFTNIRLTNLIVFFSHVIINPLHLIIGRVSVQCKQLSSVKAIHLVHCQFSFSPILKLDGGRAVFKWFSKVITRLRLLLHSYLRRIKELRFSTVLRRFPQDFKFKVGLFHVVKKRHFLLIINNWTRLGNISSFVSGEQINYLPKLKAEANNWTARH